jgi:hypothetical protein
MAGPKRLQRWVFLAAAGNGEFTARREGASFRQIGQ